MRGGQVSEERILGTLTVSHRSSKRRAGLQVQSTVEGLGP